MAFAGLWLVLAMPATSNAQWAAGGARVSGTGVGIYPIIHADQMGGAFIAWRGGIVSFDLDDNPYCQHITAAGAVAPFFPPNTLRLAAPPNEQYPADLTPDGAGGWFVVWEDFRSLNQTSDDIYAQHVLANGAVDPLWLADGAPVTASAGYQSLPHAIADGSGGVFVVWDDSRALSNDVYANHLTATGQVAAGWPANGRPLVNPPRVRYFDGYMVPDGFGGALVAWFEGTTVGGVYLLRINPDGTPAAGWDPGGTLVTSIRGHSGLAPDGLGGAFIGLANGNGVGDDLTYYLQHVTASGAIDPTWTPDGNLFCSAPGIRYALNVISDGLGGALMQWQDKRVFGGYEYEYAHRMLANGTLAPGWPVDGLRVTSLESFQSAGAMVADGTGGGYFAFESDGHSTSFIQHLTASGTVAAGWPTTGLALGQFAYGPRLASDGAHGAIAAWYRGNDYAVLAQRYVFDGIVATQLSLASSDSRADRVVLVWQGPEAASLVASVQRRAESGTWQRLGPTERDGADRLRYEDRDVTPGGRYAYRLAWVDAGEEQTTAETWIDVPVAAELALEGPRPNPAVGAINVSLSLASAAPASLELLDLAGRRVSEREVGMLGPGRHLVRLDGSDRVAPGIYWLRLRQGERQLLSRAVVMN